MEAPLIVTSALKMQCRFANRVPKAAFGTISNTHPKIACPRISRIVRVAEAHIASSHVPALWGWVFTRPREIWVQFIESLTVEMPS